MAGSTTAALRDLPAVASVAVPGQAGAVPAAPASEPPDPGVRRPWGAIIAFLNSMATEEAGNRWLAQVLVQTGIKTDPSKIEGEYADYFKMLSEVNADAKYYFGLPSQVMQGKAREVFTQVINNAFPAGNISVDDVVKQLAASY